MKKILYIWLLVFCAINSFAQIKDPTAYETKWGEWRQSYDFDKIEFRVRENATGKRRFVKAEFKNNYNLEITFTFFCPYGRNGEKLDETNIENWKHMSLKPGQTSPTILGVEDEFDMVVIQLGGMRFLKTDSQGSFVSFASGTKYVGTNPEIKNNEYLRPMTDDFELCGFCTIFKNDKDCFKTENKSTLFKDFAYFGDKVFLEEIEARNKELSKVVETPVGTAVVLGGSALVIGKSLREVAKMNKEDRKGAEETVRNNPSAFRRYEGETDEQVIKNKKKRDRRDRLFTRGIGVLIGAGMVTYFLLSDFGSK